MKTLRVILLCLLAFAGLGAQAQRTRVPIVSFVNVPVADATDTRLTSEGVKNVFLVAGELAGWKMEPLGEGVLEGSYVKSDKHTVVVTIRYDAEKYSVLYKSSKNMNERAGHFPQDLKSPNGGESPAAEAERRQRALFANRRESNYIKRDPEAVIHPFYERWVYELLDGVRVRLKRSE